MNTITFLLVTALLLILIIMFSLISETLSSKKRIKNLWDTNERWLEFKESFITFDSYYLNLQEMKMLDTTFCIDDTTWYDLDMDLLLDHVNYTFTSIGEEIIYVSLRNGIESKVDEEIIRQFEDDKAWREDVSLELSRLSKMPNSNASKFLFESYKKEKYKPYLILLSVLPFPIVGLFFWDFLVALIVLIISISTNMIIAQYFKSHYSRDYPDIFYAVNVILTAERIDKINDSDNKVFDRKTSFFFKTVSVLLVNDEMNENNIILQLMSALKSLFIIDYHGYHLLHLLFKRHKSVYKSSWHLIAVLDFNYSIAMWRKSLDIYSKPLIKESSALNGKDIYHPLIANPVSNSLTFDSNILLTGSNAAGKSTFMRALAINIILANGLNTTASQSFAYRPGKVITSMNTADNLSKGESYFVSEIKSLKRIVDESQKIDDSQLYCFIDELFKGTNTIERIASATSVISYLSHFNDTRFIVATHDLELIETLGNSVSLYNFSERVDEDDIHFDYKIKKGPAKSTNAIELIRLFEYPKEIYNQANKLAEKQVK